ncbi:MAG: hypothetical protein CR988_04875 [Treponema sp.]|nr:MAG: hypothetical protein CR988_04875 [Treponema sp.]
MLSSYSQLNSLSYVAAQRVSIGGQAYLPVNANQFIYSQFQHVSGVPTRDENSSVSVNKLQILNSLIENLIRMRTSPKSETKNPKTDEIDPKHIETLIEQVRSEIQDLDSLSEDMPYITKPAQEATLLSLTA